MAPGAVRFEHLSVFWNRPTEIDGLVLRDAQGDDIVVSPQAHFSWSLRADLADPARVRDAHARSCRVDIERSASGSVDLLETLKPILKDEPDLTLLVRVVDGKLRFRNEGLERAVPGRQGQYRARPQRLPRADRLANEAGARRRKPESRAGADQGTHEPGKGRWRLARGSGSCDQRGSLAVGLLQPPDQRPRRFQWNNRRSGTRAGELALQGDAQVLGLHATGSALSGDEVHLDTVNAIWRAGRKEAELDRRAAGPDGASGNDQGFGIVSSSRRSQNTSGG